MSRRTCDDAREGQSLVAQSTLERPRAQLQHLGHHAKARGAVGEQRGDDLPDGAPHWA
jgi:hypothetical protein